MFSFFFLRIFFLKDGHGVFDLLALGAIPFFGVVAQWLAWRLRVPSIVVLLLFGILLGPVFGFIEPDNLLGPVLFPIVSLSVAFILFESQQ
jgi:NhaP-type Na+/H+ or K+/H+ antiporter